MGDDYDAYSVMDGSYVASGRGEAVYRDMDPYGRYMGARIMALSIERMSMMRDAQDSEITIADGAHTFIFNPNGTVNYSYTSDEEFSGMLASGYGFDQLRAMFSGAPIISSYQGGPRLWQAWDGGFVQLRDGVVYVPGTNQRYVGTAGQSLAGDEWGRLNWAAAGRALVRAFVPFGNDIYPESEEPGYDPSRKIIAATMPDLPIGPSGGAKLVTNGIRLAKQLASEAQMAEKGIVIIKSGKLLEAERLAQQYGGNAADWVKKSSSSYTSTSTTLGPAKFQTHWYENVVNWLRVEFKTKFP